MSNFKCAFTADRINLSLGRLASNNGKELTDANKEDIIDNIVKLAIAKDGAGQFGLLSAYTGGSDTVNMLGNYFSNVAILANQKFSNRTPDIEITETELFNNFAEWAEAQVSNEVTNASSPTYALGVANLDGLSDGEEEQEVVLNLGEELDLIANNRKAVKGKLDMGQIYSIYFKKIPALADEFESYFKKTFYSEWIDTRVGGKGYTANLITVSKNFFEKMRRDSQSMNVKGFVDIDLSIPEISQLNIEDLLKSENYRKAFYSYVISNEAKVLAKEWLPGLVLDNNVFSPDPTFTGRTGVEQKEGFTDALDQGTAILNTHLVNTPRIIDNGPNNKSFSTDSPFLTRNDVTKLAGIFLRFDRTLDFGEQIFNKLSTLPNGDEKNILSSIYHRFYAPIEYKVDGKKYKSFKAFNSTRLNAEMTSLQVFFASIYNRESISTRNGEVYNTVDDNRELVDLLSTTYNDNISSSNDKTQIDKNIANFIDIEETAEEGIFTLILNLTKNDIVRLDVKFTTNYKSGVIVELVEKGINRSQISVDRAQTILKKLKTPNRLQTKKFLDEYNTNNLKSTNSTALPDLVANLVFMTAVNMHDLRQDKLINAGYTSEMFNELTDSFKKAKRDNKELYFPPFKYLHAFANLIAEYDKKVSGPSEPRNYRDVNDNFINKAGTASTLDTFDQIIEHNRNLGEAGVHYGNILMNKSASGYGIESLSSKDGIVIADIRKANKNFTKREHLYDAIFNLYLKFGSKNNYNRVALQVGTMSDRTKVNAAIFSGVFANPDNLTRIPENLKGGGMTKGEYKLFQYEQNYYKNLEKVIVRGWKKELESWVNDVDVNYKIEDVARINSLQTLNSFLNTFPIPHYKAAKSTVLVSNFSYKPDKADSTKPTQIKGMVLELYNIWTNNSKAKEYMKYQYSLFLKDARDFGLDEKMLSYAERSLIEERFGKTDGYKRLLKSFYYDHQLMSRASMDMFAGHLHQFKGDLDTVSDKEIQKLEDELRRATKEYSEEEIEAKKKIHRLQSAVSANVLDQSKRNSVLTSSFQRPVLGNENKGHKFLDKESNTVLISDPKVYLEILGALDNDTAQEPFDGALFMHPMEITKLNNSLGGESSGFSSKGGAIKDVQIHYDNETGTISYQKRAAFNNLINEMLLKSPVLQALFRRMNETITFTEPVEFKNKTCNNMHQMWMAAGSFNNEFAWEEILNFLHDYKDSQGNYSHRSAYIGRVTFTSAEKTGNKGINTADVLTDSKAPLIHSKISNVNYGVILQSDHSVDTTGEESHKSLPTQLIAALSFGGRNHGAFDLIKDSLASLSKIGKEIIMEEIKDKAVSILEIRAKSPKFTMRPELRGQLVEIFKNNYLTPEQRTIVNEALAELNILKLDDNNDLSGDAVIAYGKDLVTSALRHRDSVALTELLESSANSLDTPQLASLVHSAIMAEIDHKCNKIKVKGAELVLSPAHGLVKLYTLPGTNIKVSREEYLNQIQDSQITTEQLFDLVSDSDPVTIDLKAADGTVVSNKMLAIEAKYMIESNPELYADPNNYTVYAKLTVKEDGSDSGEVLQWIKYKDAEGDYLNHVNADGTFKYPVYNELIQINSELKQKGILKERKKELESLSLIKQDELDKLLKQEGWTSEEAEVVMPFMQLAAFDLYEEETDNMGKGDGSGATLSYENSEDGRIQNVGITDIYGTEETGNIYYFKNGKIYTEPVTGSVKLYQSQIEHSLEWFAGRIESNPNKYKLGLFSDYLEAGVTIDEITVLKEATVKELNNTSEPAIIYSLKEKIKSLDFILKQYSSAAYSPELAVEDTLIEKYNNDLNNIQQDYITTLANRKVRSFPQTLSVFIGRVPGQSMQSGASAKIKSFVFGNRNSIYAPAELLTISGADFDIDKVHTLVFSVDDYGNMYSYEPYLTEDGKIDINKFRNLLEEKTGSLVASLELQNASRGAIKAQVKKMRDKEYAVFQEATKNFVLEKIIERYSDPKNAIQANTPMTMDTLKSSIETEFMIDTNEDNTADLVGHSGLLSTSAASILGLEYTNMVGKDGIGIFASGLKGYSAIYDAYVTSLFKTDGKERYSSEFTRVANNYEGKADKELLSIIAELKPEIAEDPNVLVFYDSIEGDKIIKNISGVSNDENIEEKFSHAWRALSELLSAATDNAKELILARINADATTSGLIVSCLIGGVPLENTLSLFKSEAVKNLVKKYADAQDLALNPNGIYKSFSSVLRDTWYDYKSDEGFIALKEKITTSYRNLKYKKELLDSFKTVTANELLSKIGGDITKLTLISDSDFNDILKTESISVNEKDSIIYRDVQKLINEEKIKSNVFSLSQEDVIKVVKTIDNSDTLFFRPNSKNEAIYNFAKAYTDYVNSELGLSKNIVRLPNDSYTWQSMTQLNGPKIGILGEYTIGSQQNYFIQNLKLLVDKYVEASTNADAFNQSYIDQKELLVKEVSKFEKSFNLNFNAYLSSPVRQLLSFDKLGKELRIITSLLSINGGNPNSEFDSRNFIEKTIKDLDITKDQFVKFVKRANEFGEEDAFVQEQINNYEKIKFGFNPLLVLARNKHYLAQIDALMFGRSLAFSATSQAKALERISDLLPDHRFNTSNYSELKNIYHGANIHLFLESEKPVVNIYGEKFSLDTVEGRQAFIDAMPRLLTKMQEDEYLKDNTFIQRLSKSSTRDNRFNKGLDFVYIKSDNLNRLSESQKALRRLHLNSLKNKNKETYTNIHEALYLYSLITNKGFRGADDFGSLFSIGESAMYKKYIEFLNQSTAKVLDRIEEINPVALSLLASRSIKVISTAADSAYMGEDGEIDVDFSSIQSKPKFVHSRNYKFPDPKNKNKPKVFRSAQTNDIMVWNGARYLVVTPTNSDKAIPFTLQPSNNILSGSGYDWGKPAIINASGEEGRVLYYDDKEGYKVSTKAGDIYMPAEVLANFNTNMLFDGKNFGKLLESDRKKLILSGVEEASNLKPSISLGPKELGHLKQKPFYLASNEVNKESNEIFQGITVGSVLGAVNVNGIPCEYIYAGVITAKNYSVVSNMADSKLKKRLRSKDIKNRINSVHAVEIRPVKQTITSVPTRIEEAKFTSAEKIALFEKKKSKFILIIENNNIKGPEEKYVSYEGNYYKLTRKGSPLENNIFDKEQLQNKLGRNYLTDRELKYAFKESNETANTVLYEISPANLAAESTNSYLEYQNLKNKIVDQDFREYKVELHNVGSSESAGVLVNQLEKVGIRNLIPAPLENTLMDESSAEDILSMVNEDAKNLGLVINNDYLKAYINSIASADKVFFVMPIERSGKISIADNNDYKTIILDLIDSSKLTKLNDKKFKESLKNSLREYKDLSQENQVFILELLDEAENSGKFEGNIEAQYRVANIKDILNPSKKNEGINKTIPAINKYDLYPVLQAAKRAGKEVFLFSTNEKSWMKFNKDLQDFEYSAIPTLNSENNSSLIMGVNLSPDDTIALEGLFKKTAEFENKRTTADVLNVYINDVNLSGEEVNEQLNEPLKTSTSLLDIVASAVLTEQEVIEGGEFSLNSFQKFKEEDIVVSAYADNSLLIYDKANQQYYAKFNDPSVLETYANFKGSEVYENFNMKVGDRHYVLSDVHKVNIDDFRERDLYIKYKTELNNLQAELTAFYSENVYPKYAALVYNNDASYNKFKDYQDYKTLLLYASSLNFNPEERILLEDLMQASKDLNAKISELENKRATLLKGMDISTNVPNIKTVDSVPEGQTNIKRVIISDVELKNTSLSASSGFHPKSGSSYYLPLIDKNKVNRQKIRYYLERVLEEAVKNPENNYYLDLPGKYVAELYENINGITNEDVWKSISGSLYNIVKDSKSKISSWPNNLIIAGKDAGEYINSEGKGDFSKRKINRLQEYKVTDNNLNPNIINVAALAYQYKFKDGSSIADKINSDANSWSIDVHMNYWSKWAEENKYEFEELARKIGTRVLFDKNSTGNASSTGVVLTQLLNKKYYIGYALKNDDFLKYEEQAHNEAGVLLNRVLNAGLNITKSFANSLEMANVSLGFDLNSYALSQDYKDENGNLISTNSNNRIKSIQDAIGNNSLGRKFKEGDKVHLWGSSLYDFISLNNIKERFEYSVKPVINALMANKNEIIVGHEPGLDEIIRNYVEEVAGNYNYVKTKTGYKYISNGEIYEPYNYSFKLDGSKLLSSGSEFKKELSIDINETDFVNGFNVAPQDLTNRIISELDIPKSERIPFSDSLRAELVVEEQFYIQRYIAAISMMEAKLKGNFSNIDEFDEKIEEYKNNSSLKFKEIYNNNLAKVYNEDGSLKNISDLGLLAMAKSRNVTNDYLKSIFEKPLTEYNNSPYTLLNLSREAFENTPEYKDVLNNIYVTEETSRLISEAENVTYFDLYNFIKLFGENKVLLKGNILLDSKANEKLLENNILGIKVNNKYIVTDSTRYESLPDRSKQLDSLMVEKANKRNAEVMNTLLSTNASLYNFFLRQKLLSIDPYSGVLNFNIAEELYSEKIEPGRTTKEEVNNILDNGIVKVLTQMFKSLSPVIEISENDIRRNLAENRNLLGFVFNFKSPLNEVLFKNDALKDLSDDFYKFKVGNLYNYNGKKAFIINADGVNYALLNNGEILEWSKDASGWVLSTEKSNLENSSYLLPLKLANPQQVGVADALRLSNGNIIKGMFTVNKETSGDYIATDGSDNPKNYLWLSNSATWKAVQEEDLNSIYTASGSINVEPGSKVESLYTVGGLVAKLSSEAVIKSSNTVVDGDVTYKKDKETGLWKIISAFKNTKVRFQVKPITLTNALGKQLASKKVSKEAILELVSRLNSNTSSKIEVVSRLDILADERFTKAHAESSGFTLDGVAYVNIDRATLDTPLHELLGHVFLDNLRNSDRLLYDSIIEKALKEETVVKEVLEREPGLKGEDLGHEVFSTLVGLELQELSEKANNLSFWDKIMNIVEGFFNEKIKPLFGINNISKNDNLNDIIEKIGRDALYQKGSIFRDISNNAKIAMKEITRKEISEKELIERFKNNNFIKEVCL